ncbi:hypothetical protein PUMCH_001133 [Australozyma saopauloensis]|uniref:Uncharacterized protein n=1 Tax=Australozyma saopauloensis TaxID=291208 RepID=A0AAX4H602_9ASCO|nr:hypothetical protein PUMCH_001133 [[Candida] saopauloensis]
MYDLNVVWPSQEYTAPTPAQLENLYNTISMLHSFGYNYLAINFIVPESVKLPQSKAQALNPIPMADLRHRFRGFPKLRLFSRITLVLSDPAKCQSVLKINNTGAFDIVAVQPMTEKSLQLTTANLDIDLISLPMATRWPFFLKHKTVGQALSKGIKFELCYSGLIGGPAGYQSASALGVTGKISRKQFLSNSLQLIRASRSQGLVLSSGAAEPMNVRNHVDILAIFSQLDLRTSNCKEGFMKNPEAVLIKGRLRITSNKQTVMLGGHSADGETRGSIMLEGEASNALKSYKRKREDGEENAKKQNLQ